MTSIGSVHKPLSMALPLFCHNFSFRAFNVLNRTPLRIVKWNQPKCCCSKEVICEGLIRSKLSGSPPRLFGHQCLSANFAALVASSVLLVRVLPSTNYQDSPSNIVQRAFAPISFGWLVFCHTIDARAISPSGGGFYLFCSSLLEGVVAPADLLLIFIN
jgi:hypothetical protein